MTMTASERSTANTQYLRRQLRQRQPGFAAALERAADLLGEELARAPRGTGAAQGARPAAPHCRQRRRARPWSSRASSTPPAPPARPTPACGPAHR
jgi:hypothetical protein